MGGGNGEGGRTARLSALPSVQARALAFGAIVIAGICGGLIGFSAVRVGCHANCGTPEGIGGLAGALIAAAGVSVIAVLVLRAMGEWRGIKAQRNLDLMIAAATQASEEEATERRTAEGDDTPPNPAPRE